MDDMFKPGPGRKPPPVEHQFLQGTSGRNDRHVMLPAEILDLLRQWWKGAIDRV
jgi:hypothetical protein